MLGVSGLTMEERGKYITLLCLQHQLGHLSKKIININVGDLTEDVIGKFVEDENGNLYNKRMEKEIEKREGYVNSRYENGYKGGRPLGTTKKAIKEKNDWEIMLDFFDNKCIKCGYQFEKPNRPTKDHIIPKSWGGIDDISNYQPLCRECNASKCADHKEDYRLNYIDKIPNKLKTLWFSYGYDLNNHIGNDNDNEDDNVNIIENKNIYSNIISYLNNKIDSNYKYDSKTTIKQINARLNDGFKEEDFYLVIDKKVNDWFNDDKMREYLRPATLFGTKFESYLNSPSKNKTLKGVSVDISSMFKNEE
jgi:uncharacterized phage protein (TIGR02220 family)